MRACNLTLGKSEALAGEFIPVEVIRTDSIRLVFIRAQSYFFWSIHSILDALVQGLGLIFVCGPGWIHRVNLFARHTLSACLSRIKNVIRVSAPDLALKLGETAAGQSVEVVRAVVTRLILTAAKMVVSWVIFGPLSNTLRDGQY